MNFKLYQINDEFRRDYGFISLDMLESVFGETDIVLSRYDFVYEGIREGNDVYDVLEGLFEEFNINHPNDFRGRSLSVSDVVELDGEFYYCDSFGWQLVNVH